MANEINNHLILYRSYTDRGTFGQLAVGQRSFVTVELPWRGNQVGVSCIPEAIYSLGLRPSPIVKRTTQGKFTEGWEVLDVPGRSHIMIHPGNTIDDLRGCISPGKSTGVIPAKDKKFQWAVLSSRYAFAMLMVELEKAREWILDIRTYTPEYP